MQVKVLGCWAPYPKAGGACSGYLVQAGNTSLIMDLGHGVMGELQKHVDFRRLTAVVISHLHPDHYMDLYCLRHAVAGAKRSGSRQGNLDIWIPDEPRPERQQLESFSEAFNVHILRGEPLQIGELKLRFLRTDHALPCFAIALEHESKRLVYTADTAWLDSMVDFARDADLLIAEASWQEGDSGNVGHLTAGQAGELGRRAGVKELVLTHFWPEYDQLVSKQQAEKAFGREVSLAAGSKSWQI
ncbi:MAG TPA: MBL fold metallo-hydrolase [Bacillota bacterium]|nr:MBL fold metallo-hydrolase [Bacillota bacterium]